MANNGEKGSTLPRLKHGLGSCIYCTDETPAGILFRPLLKGYWCCLWQYAETPVSTFSMFVC